MEKNETLKEQTIRGVFWKFSERLITQVVSFAVSVVLARLLLPEAYGLIALVMVFITICDKLVISGFATSLIQKKDADDLDFSSVFFFSLIVSLILYTVLFFAAPQIAGFFDSYDTKLLIAVIRVMSLRIILMSINSVQHAYVSRTMQFRLFFWSTLWGTLISAAVGIWMAYEGAGVWALVAQYCVNYIVDTCVLYTTVGWRPQPRFSSDRLKIMYTYGWKLFVASLLETAYYNLRSLVIGKVHTSVDLAFYNKGNSFPQLIESNVAGTIDSVLFPAIAKKQSSSDEMRSMLRRAIRVSSYILMPLLMGLAAVADPLVRLLLTEKWLPCVPFMQLLSVSYLLVPVELENRQAIKATGRSDLVLKLEVLKKAAGILVIVFAVPFGATAIAGSAIVGALFAAVVNAIPNRRLLGYTLGMQIKDVLPALGLSVTMFSLVWPMSRLGFTPLITLVLQILTGGAVYTALSVIFKVDSFYYILRILGNVRTKRKS